MIDKIQSCSIPFNDKKKTLKDKKGGNSKYLIENLQSQDIFEIDFESCVYSDRFHDSKCDFGIKTSDSMYYIELKGSDVKKGITQLLETIKETKHCFEGFNLKARLIVSKFPKPDLVKQRANYIELAKLVKFQDKKNKNLIIKQNIHTEVI